MVYAIKREINWKEEGDGERSEKRIAWNDRFLAVIFMVRKWQMGWKRGKKDRCLLYFEEDQR